ncbi:histone H2B.2, embryonic-like [Lontra canadensis]|uniref:histone H2B.2, embryonic-like n=1 Tax=Lontra canadensis TaxID=76717 RepID=UPI0013F3780D|nr:histone H2B.2, embryonic-like [Lontra canadensis]
MAGRRLHSVLSRRLRCRLLSRCQRTELRTSHSREVPPHGGRERIEEVKKRFRLFTQLHEKELSNQNGYTANRPLTMLIMLTGVGGPSVDSSRGNQPELSRTLTWRAHLELVYLVTAVRLLLPGELAKHAVSEGTKAVTKYTSSK